MADVSELRQAANEVMSLADTSLEDDATPLLVSAVTLAKACLADHPADDDELIDERWLQSLGCQRREEWQAWVVPNDDQCVTLSRSASYPDLWDLQYETDFQWPNGLRFKRDLRVVLRALLIELTEGPAVR